jgi:hypothetical protein
MTHRVNRLKNRVVFYEEGAGGPEAHGGALEEVYECFCADYEPSTKDFTVLGASGGKRTVTISIRNVHKVFKPQYYHKFELLSGYFAGTVFDVKHIAPYSDDPQFLKIVGEA